MQSSFPLLSRGCWWVERGHGCGSQASAITLPNIAIYSSLTPNDYCTPLMRSVIFCPDSAGFKQATQKKQNSLALLRKMNKNVKLQPLVSPHNFLMSCWKVDFKTSFRSSHKSSHLTSLLWNGLIVREAVWFETTFKKTCQWTTSVHICVPAQKGAEGLAEPLRSARCSHILQKPQNPCCSQAFSMPLRQRCFFKMNKPTKQPRAPGICTGRILLVKQAKLELYFCFISISGGKLGGFYEGLSPRNPKTCGGFLLVRFFFGLGFFFPPFKLSMLLKNKTMWSNMCSEDVPASSLGSIMSPAQKGLGKLWQPTLTQYALNIFAVVIGPMPTFEPCYSDHFSSTESPFLVIAQTLVALWSP